MATPLRILHVGSEMVPFIKSGGLADVLGALPAALRRQGEDVRVAIPGYRRALAEGGKLGLSWAGSAMTIEVGGVDHSVGVGTVMLQGMPVYLLACNELFDREGLYGPNPSNDYDDNARRFAVFSKACLALPGFLGWVPHVIHAHYWQTGLVPALLQRGFNQVLPATRSVFTVHNAAYQGTFWHFDMKLTGLDWSLFNPMHLEHYGKLNMLKAGVVFADRVTTVSKRYAEELQLPDFGYGLDPVFRSHAYKLSGITNGIDSHLWDPATDEHLPAHFDRQDLAGKRACKERVREEFGLTREGSTCLVAVVSRLVEQKGLDLIVEAVSPYVLAGRMQLAILGSGDSVLENRLHALHMRHPGWVYIWYGYNEGLAHRLIAGADLFLMPSRYEPCGLTQMYSMRYGTLPLVRYTGGLADTVTDVAVPEGTGFTFGPVDLGHFSSALDRALGLYQYFPQAWSQAQQRAMAMDFSWEHVSATYIAFYRAITQPRG